MQPRRLAGLTVVGLLATAFAGHAARAQDAAPAAPEPVRAGAPLAPAPTPTPTPTPAAPAPDANPVPRVMKPAAPPLPHLPVELTIVAASPDPPWTMRIVNVGDHPVRIAADQRLLSFELDPPGKQAKVKCAAPAGFAPSKFPTARELYLEPGEAYVEDFDPRLYCFGDKVDLLRGGTEVRAHFGWKRPNAKTGPFAAEGVDKPAAFSQEPELTAPPFMLSYASFAPMPLHVGEDPPVDPSTAKKGKPNAQGDTKKTLPGAINPSASTPRPDEQPASSTGLGARSTPPPGPGTPPPAPEPTYTDRNAAKLDVYTDRYSDASAPRDAVVRIRATNESKRELVAAIRGHMLSFSVEQLGPDNTATSTVDCIGSERPHAISVEAIQDLEGGHGVSIPLLIAEICPKEAFERPGLYRVRPRIDTTAEGEVLDRHVFIGKALALQPALVRVASARKPFQEDPPKRFTPPTSGSDAGKGSDPHPAGSKPPPPHGDTKAKTTH